MNIINISHYYTSPPKSGGQLRIHNLNSKLSKNHKITQFSFTSSKKKAINQITKNYTEIVIPIFIYQVFGFFLYRLFKIPHDFILPAIFKFVSIPKQLKESIEKSDFIIVEHPWLFAWIYDYIIKKNIKKKIILNAHNVEYDLQKTGLKLSPFIKNKILKYIFKTEKYALSNSSFIISVCEEDKKRFLELYSGKKEKIKIVQNGVNLDYFKEQKNKTELRKKLGFLKKDKIVLFAAAGHPPNYQAVNIIETNIAPLLTDFKFVIAGSVSKKKYIKNLTYTGPVENIIDYFVISDISINPMLNGSGSNIKMFEYLAAGLPIISTKIGKRGLKTEKSAIICELNEFPKNIQNLYNNKELFYLLKKRGPIIAKKHNWARISKSLEKILISNCS